MSPESGAPEMGPVEPGQPVQEVAAAQPGAIFSQDATQQPGAILNAKQLSGAIFSQDVTQQPGAIASAAAMPPCASSGVPMPFFSSGSFKLRRLLPVHAFIAAGRDWTSFQGWFDAAYASVCWPMDEALKVLPTA
ncbi:unnamed protein product [Lampetra planeri]